MPTHPTRSMARRLADAQAMLAAVRREERAARRLRQVGYGEAQLDEAEALIAGVILAMAEAERAEAEQRHLLAAVRQSRAPVERALRDGLQLARAALGDEHPWLHEAGLVGPRRPRGSGPAPRDQSLDGLLRRATTFFAAARQAPDEVRERLTQGGLGEMALRLGEGLVATTQRHAEAQQRHAAERQRALQSRAFAFETLDDWMRSFTVAARVALRELPDLLDALGLKPRGRPRGPQAP